MQSTLTEIETLGLYAQHNLADGHAYQDLSPSQSRLVRSLPQIWEKSAGLKVWEAEHQYKAAFAALARSPSLLSYPHFRLCPTASNSIDLVAAWAKFAGLKVALLEPTFDNLYLLMTRRGVEVVPLPEKELSEQGCAALSATRADAIFLVNPNNPTGKNLSREEFRAVVQWCAENKKVLLLDNTFRFFVPQEYDQYQLLIDSGVTFISIEDTGKVWPTQDLKASLVVFSADTAPDVNLLYEEIYLCISNFALGILAEFLKDAHQRGLAETVWAGVKQRKRLFRAALQGGPLTVAKGSEFSPLSVEWLALDPSAGTDLSFTAELRQGGLVLLPGRHFFWNHVGEKAHTNFVRASLLKPEKQFLASLAVLKQQLSLFQKEAS